jgi:hypothetical protein
MGPGEVADFTYTPSEPGDMILDVRAQVDGWTIRVPVRVRAASSPRARAPHG